MLPQNILPGVSDSFPSGVFLIPLCTTRPAAIKMTRAIYTAFVQAQDIEIIKDFLNALQYVSDPENSPCWNSIPPEPITWSIETDGLCQRLLVDGVPVTDWICPPEVEIPAAPEPVGNLGFTISELEEMIMGCLDISGSIKLGDDGLIYVRDCDGWVVLQGMIAPMQSSSESGVEGGMSYGTWEDLGKPPLPSLPSIPHTNEAYVSAGSVQCAKATALVNALKGFMQTTWNTFEGIDSGLGFQESVALVTAGLAVGNLPGALFVASQIWGAKLTASTLMDEIDADLLDSEMWTDIICETTDLMNAGTRVETDDIDHVITNWQERDTVPEALKQIIYSYPVLSWKENTQPEVAETECGCSDHLPGGYIPDQGQEASGIFVGFREAGQPNQDVSNISHAGQILSGWEIVGADGQLVAGKYKATYIGAIDTYYAYRAGILFEFDTPVVIDELKATWEANNTPEAFGLAYMVLQASSLTWSTWSAFSLTAPGAGVLTGQIARLLTMPLATHLGIWFSALNTQAQGHMDIKLSNFLVTGTVGGVGFVNQPIGMIQAPS